MLALFAVLRPRRAVLVAFIGGWLFLPMAGYKVPELPDVDKMFVTCFGIMVGVAIFDADRLVAFRPAVYDLPATVWCLCPLASSLSNGLGLYDGLTSAFAQTVMWGLPYMVGRLYFNDWEGLRELAVGLIVGGLVYVPLCLWEIKMSPQLHRWVYGFHQHSWIQTKRWGGWRPTVFMQHGLMVGMWMAMTSLVAVWMWATGAIRSLWGYPMALLTVVMVVTSILCKSTGAIGLLGLGLGVLFAAKWLKRPWPVLCLIAMAPLYMVTRAGGVWSGGELMTYASQIVGKDRADSLGTRLRNEDMLTAKALQRPLLGWGGWGRNRVRDERGKDVSVTDGLWVIAIGKHGIVGLGALTAMLLVPGLRMWWRMPAWAWGHAAVAPAAACSAMLMLYMVDNILNGMVNPVFTAVAGGLASLPSIQGHDTAMQEAAISRVRYLRSRETAPNHSLREITRRSV